MSASMPGGESARVGFIGLGNIGAPMARRLLDLPGGLVVCDVVPEACEPLVAAGATAVATPRAVAEAGATVISVMVRDDDQVREVITGPDGILAAAAAGTVVAVHSTVEDTTAQALAAQAEPAGVHVIDAPVSGGSMGAHAGTLAFMVGGPEEAIDLARPALDAMGGLLVHAGPVGAGTRAKIARNLVTFVSYAAVGEAQRLAEAAGLDLADLGNVVRHSDAITGGPGAIWLRGTADPLPADDPLRAIFEHACGLGEKDLALALELGERLDVDLPLVAQARRGLAAALGVPHDDDVTTDP